MISNLIKKNVSLRALNTLRLDSVAEYFVEATTDDVLCEALSFAHGKGLPITVLGEGSNVVLGPQLPGLTVHIRLTGVEQDGTRVKARAGEGWHELVESTIASNVFGLENLVLIPGTVGAAPVQNLGAYGVELAEFVEEVRAINRFTLEAQAFSARDCGFSYRSSIFKEAEAETWVITDLVMRLRAEDSPDLTYTGITQALGEAGLDLSARSVAKVVSDLRRAKLPDPASAPNVGSFFKNVVVDKARAAKLRSAFPDMPMFTASGGYRIPSAWLIERAGLKGRSVGAVSMSPQHALVLVNDGKASAEDVNRLAGEVRQEVAAHFSLMLEQEPVSY